MKFFVFLLLAISAVSANPLMSQFKPTIPPTDTCNRQNGEGLGPVLQEFIALMPLEAMLDEFFNALVFDPEVIEFMNYMGSPEFGKVVDFLWDNKEFLAVLEFLCEEVHLDAYFYLNALGDLLGLRPITRPPKSAKMEQMSMGGVRGMMGRILDLIPSDQMLDLWYYKIENDPNLCKFYKKLGEPGFVKMTEEMEKDPAFIAFTKDLKKFGLDADLGIEWLKSFLWERDYCK